LTFAVAHQDLVVGVNVAESPYSSIKKIKSFPELVLVYRELNIGKESIYFACNCSIVEECWICILKILFLVSFVREYFYMSHF